MVNCWFEATNISCFKNKYEVVKDLNLKLNFSENIILMGPNGSGKSSIVELINRNIYPVVNDNVSLKIFNKELINLWELRKRISTVNSEIKFRIKPNLTVIELIVSGLYGRYFYGSNKDEKDYLIAKKLINKMEISKITDKQFSTLSDGEKQISLIARALINDPQILILDEPMANLDYKSKYFVIDRIDEISKLNTSILTITHDISTISKIYDRIIMIKDRKIIADGTQMQVMNSSNINKLFDIDVEVNGETGNWNMSRSFK